MKRAPWLLTGLAGLLLACQNTTTSNDDARALEEAPDELITQEAADQEAEAAITQDNADEEFDRLSQEIDSDQ